MPSVPPSPPSRIPRRKHSLTVVTASPSRSARPETAEVPSSRGCLSLPPGTSSSPYASPRRHQSHSRKSSNTTSIRSIPSGTRPSHHATTNPNSPTPSTSTATFPTTPPHPRHPSTPTRPKLSRISSDGYTTFNLRPPNSPGEVEEEDNGWPTKLRTWLRRQPAADEEISVGATSAKHGERQPLLPESSRVAERAEQEGLPSVTRECLIAEIKCYGFYILPPIIVFVLLALGISLWVYHTSLVLP